jgi:hypothetical protein
MIGWPAAPGIITSLCGLWFESKPTELAEAGKVGDIGTYAVCSYSCSCSVLALRYPGKTLLSRHVRHWLVTWTA